MPTSVSIVVVNHNYAGYLKAAVDSALAQTHAASEVIVVDDGSTDDSRQVIAALAERVTPLPIEAAGQNAATTAGFAASSGDIVCFLDADDLLLPHAVERILECHTPDVAKVQWPLWEINARGEPVGSVYPGGELHEGDLRERLISGGPDACFSSPMSGNAWSRPTLERIMPIPALSGVHRNMADSYLATLAPMLGLVRTLAEPAGCYRIHGENVYSATSFAERLSRDTWRYDFLCSALEGLCREEGRVVDRASWAERSWLSRLQRALIEVRRLVGDQCFVLVDEDTWGLDASAGLHALPFLEREGRYWGRPADDAEAIAEVERVRAAGARYFVVAWSAHWWLDFYAGLRGHLEQRYRRVLDNELLVGFDLRGPAGEARGRG